MFFEAAKRCKTLQIHANQMNQAKHQAQEHANAHNAASAERSNVQTERYANRCADFERIGVLDPFTKRLIWTLAQIELEEEQLQAQVNELGAFEEILTDKGDTRQRPAARWSMLKDCRARIESITAKLERVLRSQRERLEEVDEEVEAFFT